MSDCTGPIATLPGAIHPVPDGQHCDFCDAPATTRIQGETDSFGAELLDYCDKCAEEHGADRPHTLSGECDWCHRNDDDLRATRDPDEGLCGRVYYVCSACSRRRAEALLEEERQLRERELL